MDATSLYGLMLKYPSCSNFIAECAKVGEFNKLWDFIIRLD